MQRNSFEDAVIEDRLGSDNVLSTSRSLGVRDRTILQLKVELRRAREETQLLVATNGNLQSYLKHTRTENEELKRQLSEVLQLKDEFELLMKVLLEKLSTFMSESELNAANHDLSTKVATSIYLQNTSPILAELLPQNRANKFQEESTKEEIKRLYRLIIEVQQRNQQHESVLRDSQLNSYTEQSRLAQLELLRNYEIYRTYSALSRIAVTKSVTSVRYR